MFGMLCCTEALPSFTAMGIYSVIVPLQYPETFFPYQSSNCLNENQGSTLTFQLTSLVASDNLDVTSQNLFLLTNHCGWLHVPYYMEFSQHVYFTIWGCAYFATLQFGDFAKKKCILNHFNFAYLSNTKFISLAMLLNHVFKFGKLTISKIQ